MELIGGKTAENTQECTPTIKRRASEEWFIKTETFMMANIKTAKEMELEFISTLRLARQLEDFIKKEDLCESLVLIYKNLPFLLFS